MGLMSFFPKFWWKERPILAQICGPKTYQLLEFIPYCWGSFIGDRHAQKRQKNSPVVYVVGVLGGDLPMVRHMM